MADELTYDPVVEGRPWQRVRPLGPLPPVPPGRALVLVPERGPAVAVRPGERGPDLPPGGYRRSVLVDITAHVLVLPLQLPCAEKDFTFRCQATVVCAVVDPAGVVARGVRDIGSLVYGPVRELLTAASVSYGPTQGRAAEAALNSALDGFVCDPLVRLSEPSVTLRPEAAAPPPAPRTLRGEVLRRHDSAPGGGSSGAAGEGAAGGPASGAGGAPGTGGAAADSTLLNGGAGGARSSRVRGTGMGMGMGTGTGAAGGAQGAGSARRVGGAGSSGSGGGRQGAKGPEDGGSSTETGGSAARRVSRVRRAGASGAGTGRPGPGDSGGSGRSGRGAGAGAPGPEADERRRERTEGGTGPERPGGEGGPA